MLVQSRLHTANKASRRLTTSLCSPSIIGHIHPHPACVGLRPVSASPTQVAVSARCNWSASTRRFATAALPVAGGQSAVAVAPEGFEARSRQLLAQGGVLTAVVTYANKGGLVVKCEGLNGFIPFRLLGEELGRDYEALRGKELPVRVAEIKMASRELVLLHVSGSGSQDSVSWENARQLQEAGAELTATITGTNRGGVEAECEGYRGFIPFRYFGEELGRDAAALRGKEIPVTIMEVNEAKGELVLRHEGSPSADPANPQDRKFAARAQKWQDEGTVLAAVVTGANRGGLLMEVEGYKGFIPFSFFFGKDLGDVEALRGQEMQVRVAEIVKGKAELVLRPAAPEDGERLERAERWRSEGTVLTAVVNKTNKGGLMVEVEGYKGFLPFRLFGRSLGWQEVQAMLGQKVPVQVEEINMGKGELLLRHSPEGSGAAPGP